MNDEDRHYLRETHDSVIKLEETIKSLKENCEKLSVNSGERGERIRKLEIWKGRVKGIFATVTAAVVILTGAVTYFVTKYILK